MARLRPWSVTALVAWTLFTWGNRIPLLWSDDTLDTGEKVLGSLPIAVFVVLAVAAGVAQLRSAEVLPEGARRLAVGLAGWSIAYWAVRLPLILVHDHPVPFKVVHTVLALVAAGLSVWVLRGLRGRSSSPAPAARPAVPAGP